MNQKKLIAGNWKMNMSGKSAVDLADSIVRAAGGYSLTCDFVLCPPFPYIESVVKICKGSNVSVGGQDCSVHEAGAYTGEVSAEMLADIGARYVIIGHSERRQCHGESDSLVAGKAKAAFGHGLVAIVCVGETLAEREAGRAFDVVAEQVLCSVPEESTARNLVIAYEPVWAIGTGKTATPEDAEAMHSFIRGKLKSRFADYKEMRILYGGSMKPDNAKALLAMPNIDGGLIGGASLVPGQFLAIAGAAGLD